VLKSVKTTTPSAQLYQHIGLIALVPQLRTLDGLRLITVRIEFLETLKEAVQVCVYLGNTLELVFICSIFCDENLHKTWRNQAY
jgi:hypothetical protein